MHCEHLVDWMVQSKNQAFPFTEAIICVVNLLMLQLRILFVANVAFTRLFVANVVITRFLGQNFTQNFGRNSEEEIVRWSLCSYGQNIISNLNLSMYMKSSYIMDIAPHEVSQSMRLEHSETKESCCQKPYIGESN